MGLKASGKLHLFPFFWSKFYISYIEHDVKTAENSKYGLKIAVSF